MKQKLLLHVCCAPCAVIPVRELMPEFDLTLYFFNPNIHPAKEYLDRWQSVKVLAEEHHIPFILDDYPYQEFFEQVFREKLHETSQRCKFCYDWRIDESFKKADQLGISLFSTTLLYSKYQNHELIVQSAQRAVKNSKRVRLFYKDFRPFFEEGKLIARNKGYYMQKYCGCIFSNEDRYEKQLKRERKNTK